MISDKDNHENVKYNRKRESEKKRHSSYGKENAQGRKREKETISLVPWLFSPLRFTSLCARIQDREGQTGVQKKGAKGRRDGLAREEA